MGVSYLSVSAVCTVLSFISLRCWTQISIARISSDTIFGDNLITSNDANNTSELFLWSHTTLALAAVFALNVFVLLILCLKTIFFAKLYTSEIRKLLERLVNYIIYKGTFLLLVIPPTLFQAGLWCAWLAVICSLKMFQALARDRFERLNASPSVTPWTYFRVYSALLLVLSGDFLWTWLCLTVYHRISSSMFLLLFFEPLSIAFETLQAIVVHGFQLVDIWLNHTARDSTNTQISKLFAISATGSLAEWKGILTRNIGFFLDIMTLLMAVGHYLQIWWLHGMAFHLVDAVLFLNIRALLSAIGKRITGFIKLKRALGALHVALPDATSDELHAYDDECAICREPMAKAKKLSCNHLFHLACLRSWLDQGLRENYSCPTCRKPLLINQPENEVNQEVSSDEQLARQLSANIPPIRDLSPETQIHNNPLETLDRRGTGIDTGWLGIDGAGPRSVGMSRVQMMMRQLAAVGETYAQTALDDAAWSLWHMNPSQASTSNPSPTPNPNPTIRYPPPTSNPSGVHLRTPSSSHTVVNDSLANLLAMAETVREVLPHVPDEIILQDLQRTNSATVTVNNLLQM